LPKLDHGIERFHGCFGVKRRIKGLQLTQRASERMQSPVFVVAKPTAPAQLLGIFRDRPRVLAFQKSEHARAVVAAVNEGQAVHVMDRFHMVTCIRPGDGLAAVHEATPAGIMDGSDVCVSLCAFMRPNVVLEVAELQLDGPRDDLARLEAAFDM
jgi:hypothetical protein